MYRNTAECMRPSEGSLLKCGNNSRSPSGTLKNRINCNSLTNQQRCNATRYREHNNANTDYYRDTACYIQKGLTDVCTKRNSCDNSYENQNDGYSKTSPKKKVVKNGSKRDNTKTRSKDKVSLRPKQSLKENNPCAGVKKKVVVKSKMCNGLIQHSVLQSIDQAQRKDPASNLTQQIKTNIDNIRAQSEKRSSILAMACNNTQIPQYYGPKDNTANPYIQRLREEINANRRFDPTDPGVNTSIQELQKEILQYKLKSDQEYFHPMGPVVTGVPFMDTIRDNCMKSYTPKCTPRDPPEQYCTPRQPPVVYQSPVCARNPPDVPYLAACKPKDPCTPKVPPPPVPYQSPHCGRTTITKPKGNDYNRDYIGVLDKRHTTTNYTCETYKRVTAQHCKGAPVKPSTRTRAPARRSCKTTDSGAPVMDYAVPLRDFGAPSMDLDPPSMDYGASPMGYCSPPPRDDRSDSIDTSSVPSVQDDTMQVSGVLAVDVQDRLSPIDCHERILEDTVPTVGEDIRDMSICVDGITKSVDCASKNSEIIRQRLMELKKRKLKEQREFEDIKKIEVEQKRVFMNEPIELLKAPKRNSFINQEFLMKQIAGMQKIDQLVEEAEHSITKVVKGFDKLFKEEQSENLSVYSDGKRKIEFDVDDSCNCPETMRCDCEISEKEVEQMRISYGDEQKYDEDMKSEDNEESRLNTISERSEAVDDTSSIASNQNDIYTVQSIDNTAISNAVPLTVKNIKKNFKISIDTINIVHIPPDPDLAQDISDGTNNIPQTENEDTKKIPTDMSEERNKIPHRENDETTKIPRNAKVLGVQHMPILTITPPCVVQKIFNINITGNGTLDSQSRLVKKPNIAYIEMTHDSVDKTDIPVIDKQVINDEEPSSRRGHKNCASRKQEKAVSAESVKIVSKLPESDSTQSCKVNRTIPEKIIVKPADLVDISCVGCYKDEKFQGKVTKIMNDIGLQLESSTSVHSSNSDDYVYVQDHSTQVSGVTICRKSEGDSKGELYKDPSVDPSNRSKSDTNPTFDRDSSNDAESSSKDPAVDEDRDYDTSDSRDPEVDETPNADSYIKSGSNCSPCESFQANTELNESKISKCDKRPPTGNSMCCGPSCVLNKLRRKLPDQNEVDEIEMNVHDLELPKTDFIDNKGRVQIEDSVHRKASVRSEDIQRKARVTSDDIPEDSPEKVSEHLIEQAIKSRAPETITIKPLKDTEKVATRATKSIETSTNSAYINHGPCKPDYNIVIKTGKVSQLNNCNDTILLDKTIERKTVANSEVRNTSKEASPEEFSKELLMIEGYSFYPQSGDDGPGPCTYNSTYCSNILEGMQIADKPTCQQHPELRQNKMPQVIPCQNPAPPNLLRTGLLRTCNLNQYQFSQDPRFRQGICGSSNDQHESENLAKNLLLSQLNDHQNDRYYKNPSPYFETSSSEDTCSHSSCDYRECNRYLMKAKRRQQAFQRGIITDSDEDIKMRPLDLPSDGELSTFSTSTGEVIPIGPNLLKNKSFLRRHPDKMFQLELNNRKVQVKKEYNYFDNWVSYYVSDSKRRTKK